ncbi:MULTISPECIES: hypothetical protein [unclassified Streptomyces]|uniref:hypothetical protein n=1 Tax=unclassified Streptomyces TaxID=2593676 RepID=UPI002DD91D60|nr:MULTISPECIES: hypothetical protein [unclassified Streptomyces]WSA94297.1 hypothetical protein OIE63_24010 [Streptomyces sp. NBC_01795]WSB78713.1 hypothetical protein OHB04_25120 [Streptomyces sp. NBC_01775]WSS13082.1 hypothetical protein OG533_15110 [Streptomyces sp. NBC_01186]WSS41865.1 hypothetical protein OG220_15635 [Streptomyces sp. NBC_01187]
MVADMSGGDREVSVQLSECGGADAEVVFEVLDALFPSDWKSGAERRKADVWMAQFDIAQGTGRRPEPVALATPVAAELQGPPTAVDKLLRVLDDAFTVREELHVAGDQETQLRLRLESR